MKRIYERYINGSYVRYVYVIERSERDELGKFAIQLEEFGIQLPKQLNKLEQFSIQLEKQ
jgi:hypothetical protein